MSKKPQTTSKKPSYPGYTYIQTVGEVTEFILKSNGLRVLHQNRPDTGVVTTNITYLVGARDEDRGETGVAHMLEHMLFKPTTFDLQNGIDSAAMQFERETGCILNANTWKDRTTYFFSYPKQYIEQALRIEAQRMTSVVLTDESLAPERDNVLSEFDMNNGDPYFALNVAMVGTAYHSHPYGHETIGYREDIEQYSAAMLDRFYKQYYRPDNAVMMVIGDISEKTALSLVRKEFEAIARPTTAIKRYRITEPKQEGLRRVTVERPSELNIVSIGFKHNGFPSTEWFTASTLLAVLTEGPESILHKALVDTGLATSIDGALEPTSEENLGMLTITLSQHRHAHIEEKVLQIINTLTVGDIAPLLKKVKARLLTDELFSRESSLKITQELTEYVSSQHWTAYARTSEILTHITPAAILNAAKKHFTQSKLTIGYFIGTKK